MLARAVPFSRYSLARYLRRTMSGVEWNLWSCLRARQVDGFKFRRKAVIGPYIVDFACLSARLVVEIDGDLYYAAAPHDDGRAQWLETRGFRVLQFASADVAERLDYIVGTISAELAARPVASSPSVRGRDRIRPAGPGRGSFRALPSLRRRPGARGP